MKQYTKQNKILNIENIINQRLQLQSTQRRLDIEFDITAASFSGIIKHKDFISNYIKWDITKQERFCILIGGPANKKVTKEVIGKYLPAQPIVSQ